MSIRLAEKFSYFRGKKIFSLECPMDRTCYRSEHIPEYPGFIEDTCSHLVNSWHKNDKENKTFRIVCSLPNSVAFIMEGK